MSIKMFKNLFTLIIICILAFSLAGCSNNDSDVINEKANSEISYLDEILIKMLNSANGISIENYIVKAEEVKSKNMSEGSEGSSNSEGENSNNSSEGEAGENSNNNSSSSDGSGQSNKNDVNYKMVENGILLQDRKVNWQSMKASIEGLYSEWTIIQLDLYKLNVNNQDIINFSADLDLATQAIKNEDKIQTLNTLAKLYSYIPKYTSIVSNNTIQNSVYSTKSSLLNAYSLIEQEDFNKVKQEITNAEQSFMFVINNINSDTANQFNINKAYVLIKDIQNSVDNRDKDIFYIKYKNLIQELNIIR